MIYHFKDSKIPELLQIGGKAKALMETIQAGFPVPEGIVLSVDFFKPWLENVKSSDEFKRCIKETNKDNCDAVKNIALSQRFTKIQSEQFISAFGKLEGHVFAVRSSSPEEDLEGTSFAGMYETYLGTVSEKIEETVALAFSSCFDFRVMEYKKQNGLNIEKTSIAIVIQRQIASEVSGVGFSLNPLNNCYDEVVINASFGLGEAIVSGIVTPDTYVYDYVEKKIIEKKVNEKEIGLWLKADGGIVERANTDKIKQALSDEHIVELSDLIKKCETFYGKPMDTEWAFEGGKLYLLQSRPITTYLPFFKELLTEPGEKKRFYMDVYIMTQGFSEPMSVLGLELWATMLDEVKGGMMSPHIKGSSPALYGRQYMSFTDLQKVVGKKGVEKLFYNYDGNIKSIFENIDIDSHIPDKTPIGCEKFKSRMSKMLLKMLPGVVRGLFMDYRKVVKEYNEIADEVILKTKALNKDDDFKYNATQVSELLLEIISTISVIMSGLIAQNSIKKMFKGHDLEKEIIALSMDLDGNPTSAMGHLLFKLASYEEFKMVSSRDEFIRKCELRSFSQNFLKDYDEFMEKYAVRGMREIDVASMRVDEDLGILYDKLENINTDESQITTVKEKRKVAYDKLLDAARTMGKEKKFVRAAATYQGSFGYREHPKYIIVYTLGMLHKMCLEIAKEWVSQGRLEEPYQIFDLHVDEISRAQKDPSFDLMSARERNLEGYKKVEHITDWPLVIDSRGKIYKPKLEIKDGDIVGDPIAPGKIVGRAKVLRSPYEKVLEPGEILIARATEPSWTPIFINAAGVIMEIGGPLQHGGIIAREYGIPCVSGLVGIMDIIEDGDLVEVDGYNGVVKILENGHELKEKVC